MLDSFEVLAENLNWAPGCLGGLVHESELAAGGVAHQVLVVQQRWILVQDVAAPL